MSAQHTLTVTQADREAGAAYWAGQGHHGSAEQCRTGKGFTYTAEAFARHREQSQAELLEVLEEAERQLDYMDSRWPTGTTPPTISRIQAAIAKAKGLQL